MSGVARGIEFHRYLVLVCGIYLMSVSGSIYLYASFSGYLQILFGYDQTKVALIGTLGNVGGWVGMFPGFFYDRFGSRLTAVVGALSIFIGYGYVYLACEGYVSSNYIVMGIMLAIMGQGSSAAYSIAISTNVKNFSPELRGTIVGILVCFFGLCGGIYTSFMRGFFPNATPQFILFMAVTYSLVTLVFGCLSTESTEKEDTAAKDRSVLVVPFVLAGLTTVFIGLSNVIGTFFRINPIYFSVVLVFLIAWFLYVPIFNRPIFRLTTDDLQDTANEFQVSESQFIYSKEMHILQAMKTLDFWLMFFIFFLSIGSGIVTVNNVNNIVLSLENIPITNPPYQIPQSKLPDSSTTKTFIVLFSVFNTLGRMIAGFLSDKLRNHLTTESLLGISVGLMCLTQIYMIFTTIPMMYGAVIILGISYGGIFCLFPVLVGKAFGTRYFAGNWGSIGLAAALGSIIFSTVIAGNLSDHFVSKGSSLCVLVDNKCSYICLGTDCYRWTFIITAIASFVGVILSLVLRRRNTEVIQLVYT